MCVCGPGRDRPVWLRGTSVGSAAPAYGGGLMAVGCYAIGEGMTLSLASRADQRSFFAGLTSMVQLTVFFALAAAAPHASIVSRLSRDRVAAATIPSQHAGPAHCIRIVPASHSVGSARPSREHGRTARRERE